MKVVKYKVFFAGGYEKEELWLNEMSRQGLQLSSVDTIRYEFETDETKTYIYQLEHLDEAPTDMKSITYIEAMKEKSIEYVCSYNQWVYFRKEASLGAFELRPDIDSKIDHYNRLLAMLGILTVNAVVLFVNSLCILFNIYILNLVISILLGISCLIAFYSLIQIRYRISRLKKKKKAQK